jgi:hypothetical protein
MVAHLWQATSGKTQIRPHPYGIDWTLQFGFGLVYGLNCHGVDGHQLPVRLAFRLVDDKTQQD